MALGYFPSLGEVLKCDFSGFQPPEMHKGRHVVVISPKTVARGQLVTIVPLSTTEPDPIEKWHFRLTTELPQNVGTGTILWAKCDMVFAASFNRLNAFVRDRAITDRRVFKPVILSDDEIVAIRKGVLYSLGLGALTLHV